MNRILREKLLKKMDKKDRDLFEKNTLDQKKIDQYVKDLLKDLDK